jgi:hypothetical protein
LARGRTTKTTPSFKEMAHAQKAEIQKSASFIQSRGYGLFHSVENFLAYVHAFRLNSPNAGRTLCFKVMAGKIFAMLRARDLRLLPKDMTRQFWQNRVI